MDEISGSITGVSSQAMVLAGLHSSAPARRAAVDGAKRLVAQSAPLAVLIVAATRHWLRQPFSGPTYISASDDSGVSRVGAIGCCSLLLPPAVHPLLAPMYHSLSCYRM